jgi:hypothetical protein
MFCTIDFPFSWSKVPGILAQTEGYLPNVNGHLRANRSASIQPDHTLSIGCFE